MNRNLTTLESFFYDNISIYRPASENLLSVASLTALNNMAFRYTFSVESMQQISHIIEQAVLDNHQAADVHVSFQHVSRLKPQLQRYVRISRAARSLSLYGEMDIDVSFLSDLKSPILIDTYNSPMRNYWFIIAYGPGINMSLLAREDCFSLDSAVNLQTRCFEGFYTFEAEIAYRLLRLLHQLYPHRVPPPRPPDELSM